MRFREFNGDWKEKNINQLCQVIGGGTPSTENEEYWNGNINWYTPSEIGQTKYVSNSERKITELGLKKSSAKLLPKGTILLSTRATIGECSITKTESSTNQGFQSLITNNQNNNEFIYYLIPQFKKEMIRKSSGSTFLEISKKEVEKLKVFVPSLNEQKEISNFLSLIDKKIEFLEKKLVLYQKFNESMKEELFTNFEPYTKLRLNKFLKESKIKSKDNINRRLTVKLNLKGITKREVKSVEKEGATTQYLRKEGQFIYGKQNLHKGAFGIIPKELDNYLSSSDIPSFDFIEDTVNPMWFYFYFSRKSFYIKLERFSIGTGSKRISPDEFLNIQISIPELNIQNKQAEFLNNLNKKENVLKNEISSMEIYKKYLLQKMFV